MKTLIHLNSKINIFFCFTILFINYSCTRKVNDEKVTTAPIKLFENGILKVGFIKNNLKVGKWVYYDSITKQKVMDIYYVDTVIGLKTNKLQLKKYFNKDKLFLIERVLNDEQIIGLKVVNYPLYSNLLNNNEYHEAGQGMYLFYCMQCHLNKNIIKNNSVINYNVFFKSFKKNKIHQEIILNNEEFNQLYIYIKKQTKNK